MNVPSLSHNGLGRCSCIAVITGFAAIPLHLYLYAARPDRESILDCLALFGVPPWSRADCRLFSLIVNSTARMYFPVSTNQFPAARPYKVFATQKETCRPEDAAEDGKSNEMRVHHCGFFMRVRRETQLRAVRISANFSPCFCISIPATHRQETHNEIQKARTTF